MPNTHPAFPYVILRAGSVAPPRLKQPRQIALGEFFAPSSKRRRGGNKPGKVADPVNKLLITMDMQLEYYRSVQNSFDVAK